MESENLIGQYGWLAVGAVVLAWDVLAPETMSNAFKRSREHEVGRYVTAAATGYLIGHLYDIWDERHDPLDLICKGVGRWKKNKIEN